MDLGLFSRHEPTVDPRLATCAAWIIRRLFAINGVTIDVEGAEHLGREPAILACNATHQYDPLPIRYALHVRGHPATTLSKGKNYHGLILRTVASKLGSIPLVSRGYIIVADVRGVFGRNPSDEEYRVLRDHIDAAAPLPKGEFFEMISGRPRTILGYPFDPANITYRQCVHALYREMMRGTLALCRRALAKGHSLHIYPQGSSATRLSEGHIGAVQLAHALHTPVFPIGVSGCRDVFPDKGSARMAPGQIRLRIGKRFVPDLGELPDTYEPFHPEHERAHGVVIRRETQRLMGQINDLLDPSYRWASDKRSDGASGVNRFV